MPPPISDDEASEAGFDKRVKEPRKKKAIEREDDDEMIDEDINGGAQVDTEQTTGADEEDEDDEEGDEEEEEDDDDDLDENEFVVEKIITHMIDDDGKPRFHVKWEGFDRKADLTWEPEENLTGSADVILQDYYARLGGREKLFEQTTKAIKTKKRGRPSNSTSTPSGASAKRSRKNGIHPTDMDSPANDGASFKPPSGSWEEEIDLVDMCRNDDNALIVYLTWKNGHKTQHPTKTAYQRCPQKILAFYESKINFRTEE